MSAHALILLVSCFASAHCWSSATEPFVHPLRPLDLDQHIDTFVVLPAADSVQYF